MTLHKLDDGIVVATTKPCPRCGRVTQIQLDQRDLVAWAAWTTGTFAHVAFAHWPDDRRELLVSGIHQECWQLDEEDGDE